MFKTFVYSFLMMVLFVPSTFAQSYPEAIAFENSLEAVGQVLSSPALPSLDNDGRFSITPVLGIVKIEGVDYTTVNLSNNVTSNNEVHGTTNGQVAGLTFNYSGSGDVGLFAIGAWSKVTGEMSLKPSGTSVTTDTREILGESYIAAAGLTYRFIGDAKSKFAMGVFGGPALIKSKTSANIYHSGGVTKTSVDPDLSGVYVGMQFTVRLGEFRINPYVNLLGNFNAECLQPQYSGSTYSASTYNTCNNGNRGVTALAMMAGAGINVGYGRFQFGLITKGGSSSSGLKATPLMLSFRISL
jgi:hypothetical protein